MTPNSLILVGIILLGLAFGLGYLLGVKTAVRKWGNLQFTASECKQLLKGMRSVLDFITLVDSFKLGVFATTSYYEDNQDEFRSLTREGRHIMQTVGKMARLIGTAYDRSNTDRNSSVRSA